ncbi:MAG: succinate--CoA ligase subunit alpha [Anaerolineae bacterium]|nr:succinate--CoA ligase subunit alpha [Chloroflexota bacterium]MBP6298355.1 succinate--CoA ligase subunit alpha [Anaerolineae bacterium]
MTFTLSRYLRVIVQGVTGREGGFHAQHMLKYGTQVVAGVTPGKGGEWAYGVQVLDSVVEAVEVTEANASVIFVPPAQAADAIFEAIDAGLDLIVCITEGIPVHDMLRVMARLRGSRSRLIGPNCPGLVIPGVSKLGIIPNEVILPGRVGVVSRSGTLTYEVLRALTDARIGQSLVVGIGGDPLVGTSLLEILEAFEADPDTDAVALIGEIGGRAEIDAAEFIATKMTKPVTAFIAGQNAPHGVRMGHAGAIVNSDAESAEAKIAAMKYAGAVIAETPQDFATILRP